MVLSNNAKQVLIFMLLIIFLCVLCICLAYISSPTNWDFNVNFITDNNTLELLKMMNVTRGITP